MHHWGLVNLMRPFGDKCCMIRRGMVYCVLLLSHEAETIKVNYSISAAGIMRRVLEFCKKFVCLYATTGFQGLREP
jgi:hypothetical protein